MLAQSRGGLCQPTFRVAILAGTTAVGAALVVRSSKRRNRRCGRHRSWCQSTLAWWASRSASHAATVDEDLLVKVRRSRHCDVNSEFSSAISSQLPCFGV